MDSLRELVVTLKDKVTEKLILFLGDSKEQTEQTKKTESFDDTIPTDTPDTPDTSSTVTDASSKAKDVSSKAKDVSSKVTDTLTSVNDAPKSGLSILFESSANNASLILYIVLYILLSSLVANEMIVYPAPMRLAFFIFTMCMCYFSTTVAVVLVFYYIVKASYAYYVYNMEDGRKDELIMPTLFAIIPLFTPEYFEKSNYFIKFFCYPFIFPGTDRTTSRYKEKFEDYTKRIALYKQDLTDSFPYLKNLKDEPEFKNGLDRITQNFNTINNFKPSALPAVIASKTSSASNASKTSSATSSATTSATPLATTSATPLATPLATPSANPTSK
jgi:hypothetical protein